MPTSLRLSPDIEKRLERLVVRTGRSKAFYLREIVLQGLDDIEDYYLGMEVLERIRKGEEQVFSEAEVRRELGLDD